MLHIKIGMYSFFKFFNEKKIRSIRPIFQFDIEKWLWRSELCRIWPWILKRLKNQKYFLTVFIVLWSCLVKLLAKNKFDHTIVCKGDKFSDEIIVRHMTYLQDLNDVIACQLFLFTWCKFVWRYDEEHIWEF